jgi:hypothetical protein
LYLITCTITYTFGTDERFKDKAVKVAKGLREYKDLREIWVL